MIHNLNGCVLAYVAVYKPHHPASGQPPLQLTVELLEVHLTEVGVHVHFLGVSAQHHLVLLLSGNVVGGLQVEVAPLLKQFLLDLVEHVLNGGVLHLADALNEATDEGDHGVIVAAPLDIETVYHRSEFELQTSTVPHVVEFSEVVFHHCFPHLHKHSPTQSTSKSTVSAVDTKPNVRFGQLKLVVFFVP